MNLTIDAGNTTIKVMVFNDNVPLFREEIKKISVLFLKKIFSAFPVSHSILSAVVKIDPAIPAFLKTNSQFIFLSEKTSIPVKNKYKTPETLGRDRLAAAIAGNFLFPKQDVLVIDAGTCIKYDFVNERGEYLGGSISPGLAMRFNALHEFTGQLPLVSFDKIKILTGNTTETSIQTGVINGIQQEIAGFIALYRKKYPSLKVVMSGGDSIRFAEQLNLSIFAASDLVNLGLNEIIRYNVKK
jgi:type III pantothenate kinase